MRLIPWRLWTLALLSAILQILSFPIAGPIPVWRTALCWVALLPLLYALVEGKVQGKPLSLRQAALLGYGCGFIWFLGNCYWIYQTMYLYGGLPRPVAAGILALFALYLGLYHALFGFLIGLLRRSKLGRNGALLLAPVAWVAVELARARITGFPWDMLGGAQVDSSLLTRLAPFTGVYGLSFVIVLVNALWLVRLRLRDRRFTRPALTLAGVVIVLGYALLLRQATVRPGEAPTATATLLQENLAVGAENTGPPETQQQLLAFFSDLSRNPTHIELNGIPGLPGTRTVHIPNYPYIAKLSGQGYQPTDLIVWPEAPSGFQTNDPAFREAVAELARSTGTPLVIGSLGVVPDPAVQRGAHVFGSAALIDRDGTSAGRYDKIHLVPFGEYIPFEELFFFARRLTAGVGDTDPGVVRTVFRAMHGAPEAQSRNGFGVFICYESIFGDEVRQFVSNGAEVLVNISDDGWYGDSGAPWQHLNMVRMRAIENHRWILRSTNTGITSSIDPTGRVVAALPRHIRSAINVPFAFEHDTTFYTRHGDLFAYACALATALAAAYSLYTRRKYTPHKFAIPPQDLSS